MILPDSFSELTTRRDGTLAGIEALSGAIAYTWTLLRDAGATNRHGSRAAVSLADDSEDSVRFAWQEVRAMGTERKRLRIELRELDRAIVEAQRRESIPWPISCEDVAELLAVRENTVHVWRKRRVIPAPAGFIGGNAWWWRADVIAWAIRTRRMAAPNSMMEKAA